MKNKPIVTMKADANKLRIYMDGALHLFVRRRQVVGMQSWREKRAASPFKIEFTAKDADPILLEYDDEKKWKAVLAVLDNAFEDWR